MPSDQPTPETLAALQAELGVAKQALRDLAAVVDAVIVHRGQVSHLDRDLRARLSQLVRSLRPPPAGVAPSR